MVGDISIGIAGGRLIFCLPIGVSKKLAETLLALSKAKSVGQKIIPVNEITPEGFSASRTRRCGIFYRAAYGRYSRAWRKVIKLAEPSKMSLLIARM